MGKIFIANKSTKGQNRERNEDIIDWFLPDTEDRFSATGALFVVIDGYGGRKKSNVSASLIESKIKEFYFIEKKFKTSKERLSFALLETNKYFYKEWKENNNKTGIGASVTLASIKGHSISIANIGDSRIYLIRNRAIKQITKDHTWISEHKGINLKDENFKNILTKSLGSRLEVKTNTYAVNLKPNDIILLTTDGITDNVEDIELRETVLYRELEDIPTTIVHYALKNKCKDNAANMIIKISEVPICLSDFPLKKSVLIVDSDNEEIDKDDIDEEMQEEEDFKKKEKINIKKLLGFFSILFILIVIITLVIINPFKNFSKTNNIKTIPINDTINNEQVNDTNEIYIEPILNDTLIELYFYNSSSIYGLADKSYLFMKDSLFNIIDTIETNYNLVRKNIISFDTIFNPIYLYNPINESEKLNIIFSSFPIIEYSNEINKLSLILDIGNDLENAGNYLPDTLSIDNIYLDTIFISIIARHNNDSLSIRIAENLHNNYLNNIPIVVAFINEPIDTLDKQQTRIKCAENELQIARSLSYSLGLNGDMYVRLDSIPKIIWILNKSFNKYLEQN